MRHHFLIHHLSDIHIGPLRYAPERRVEVAPESPHNVTFYREYLQRLARSAKESLPDIVIVSGDLTSYADQREFDLASDEIGKIVAALRVKEPDWRRSQPNAPYLFMVPGNHDLDWTQETYDKKVERYARLASNLARDGSVLSAIYHNDVRPAYYDFGDECNILLYLFSSISLGGSIDPRISAIYKELSQAHSLVTAAKPDQIIGPLEQLHKLGRQDPGYVDENHLRELIDVVARVPDRRLKIAVMHHNLASVPSGDIDAYDAIINAGSVKMKLSETNFDLVLHGHRHFLHSNHERILTGVKTSSQGFFTIGADSLGCKPNAPFVGIDISDPGNAHGDKPPAAIITASEYNYNRTTYNSSGDFAVMAVHRPMYASVDSILKNVGRQPLPPAREQVKSAFNTVSPELQILRMEMLDYYDEQWVEDFHALISDYHYIFATDLAARSSIESALYGKYLRQQFAERLRKLHAPKDPTDPTNPKLCYSHRVYNAILCTDWTPTTAVWGDHEIAPDDGEEADGLEIVRVLLRNGPPDSKMEIWALQNLDTDHRNAAVPLFVLDVSKAGNINLADFAIGLRPNNEIVKCIQFNNNEMRPVYDRRSSYSLLQNFERLLDHSALQTVAQYLGRSWMIQDPEKRMEFAKSYDQSRQPSEMYIDKLTTTFAALQQKGRGVEFGCGTGNYTIPMLHTFDKVYGLDVSEEMLEVAHSKPNSDHVEWVCANALRSALLTDYFDGVWGVSMLHYFRKPQQRLLLQEIFRILRQGGLLMLDIEFEEQHGSLWIVDFFPSLRKRYQDRILSKSLYISWLEEIGFSPLEFDHFELSPADKDKSLRCGQHDPKLYLDEQITANIPAFSEMANAERRTGLEKLRRAIETRSIDQVIAKYQANMPGDIGVIIAKKN
jgi:ubiquinone/menaquinone biosynthesis C-methylase UbiE/3',5'-cyclic AMP phosphodiesterase CpdA